MLGNLRATLNTEDERLLRKTAKEVFINFAKYLVDFFRFSKLNGKFINANIKVIGKANLDEALKKGKGAILLAAHIGNYELGAATISLLGYPFNAVALDHKNKLVNNFFITQRKTAKINVIPLGMALKKCFKCLKNNEVLALLGDRDFLNHGIRMRFFDKDAMIPRGAAALSLRTGAAIIPTFFIRLPDDTFELTFEKPISFSPKNDFEETVAGLTGKGIRIIEEYVKKYPSQWYMFRRFWI